MTVTISENYNILPILRFFVGLFIGKENLSLYDNLDWEKSRDTFQTDDFTYPDYYISQDFHGTRYTLGRTRAI